MTTGVLVTVIIIIITAAAVTMNLLLSKDYCLAAWHLACCWGLGNVDKLMYPS